MGLAHAPGDAGLHRRLYLCRSAELRRAPYKPGCAASSAGRRPPTTGSPKSARMGGAIFVLSMVLYPYVFLTARASFIRQPGTQIEVARALGQTAWGAFRRVALPLARPAIAVGVSLALMECLNDIGAAGFFGVRTLTLGDLHHLALAGKSRRCGADRGGDAGLRLRPAVDRTRGPAAAQSFVMPTRRPRAAGPRAPARLAAAGSPSPSALLPILIGFVVPALILVNFAAPRASIRRCRHLLQGGLALAGACRPPPRRLPSAWA